MKIGDLAKAAQCTVETIRYYERMRLLPKAGRTVGNYRLYSPKHLERLRFIRNCRALDMSQEEVRELLRAMDRSTSDCGSVNGLLEEHIGHVDERLRELRGLKKQLVALRTKCRTRRDVRDCAIVHDLSTMSLPKRKTASHLG